MRQYIITRDNQIVWSIRTSSFKKIRSYINTQVMRGRGNKSDYEVFRRVKRQNLWP